MKYPIMRSPRVDSKRCPSRLLVREVCAELRVRSLAMEECTKLGLMVRKYVPSHRVRPLALEVRAELGLLVKEVCTEPLSQIVDWEGTCQAKIAGQRSMRRAPSPRVTVGW
jgi:hypothetical protein